ncbi:uncharacterized protein PV07_00833 [Cladophialophora immunda]|uniref:VOC domain-containing protein n=1 Tax=Cladophialophora immunda TaxID=569365 RepID=A0A0D2A0X2_9EURO|nr:uncharacterized protein PV07_00833 [Cladophialophora immunda]KIW34031.1 hypothetical protein PV07_00833 [Cladophialophora immunda]OQV03102.1 Glyoxalase-like domain-containing protein [Cladophialophora immunda]
MRRGSLCVVRRLQVQKQPLFSARPGNICQRFSTSKTNMAPDSTSPKPPKITHILETCLMVKDVGAATEFYKNVFDVEPFMNTPRMSGFALSQTTLLLFQLGATAADSPMPDNRGTIPGHGPSQDILDLLLAAAPDATAGQSSSHHPTSSPVARPGRLNQHFCLAVASPADVQAWERWFEDKDVEILGRVNWPRGGKSVYFGDLDGNVGEIASRGIWEHY